MTLIVAGNKKEYPDGMTVAHLIKLEKVETPDYVIISINDEFIKNGTYAETTLNDGDSVEFLYFMGGGRYGF
jgi:sulfur carrier protein